MPKPRVALRVVFRTVAAAAMLTALAAGAQEVEKVKPMAADAHPSFEVAAIKASDPSDQSHRFSIDGRRILIENQTVAIMIEMAYGVHPRQVVDAPEWADTERFDVEGVPDAEGHPDIRQFKEMVQKLLEDRFGLKLHMEKREMPRYSLTVAKGGEKLIPTTNAPNALPSINGSGDNTTMTYTMKNVSVEALAQNLGANLDRPVVDETGLQGKYDLTLKWSRNDADADNTLPGFFTAIQEQLGLKMEPTKGDVTVLVIDHVERPSQN